MAAMKQLEQTLMECPINDLATIFLRRLMMRVETGALDIQLILSIISHLEEESISRHFPRWHEFSDAMRTEEQHWPDNYGNVEI